MLGLERLVTLNGCMTYDSDTVVVDVSGLVKLFFEFRVFTTRPDEDRKCKRLKL